MKYVTVEYAGREVPGVLDGDSVLLLSATDLTDGKSIDDTMPLGPWIVTADEVGDPQDIHLQCLVNGEVRQDASPAGIGNAREPQVFLQGGDVVVTRSDKLGELHNRVARA